MKHLVLFILKFKIFFKKRSLFQYDIGNFVCFGVEATLILYYTAWRQRPKQLLQQNPSNLLF